MVLVRFSLVFCLTFSALAAPDIRITAGLQKDQILQRDLEGLGQASLTGTTTGKKLNGKAVEARLIGSNGVVKDWQTVGQVQKQAWTAQIKGIPTGWKCELKACLEQPSSTIFWWAIFGSWRANPTWKVWAI